MASGSNVIVATGNRWLLIWPLRKWHRLTDEEQAAVIARQAALFDAMRRSGDDSRNTNDGQRRAARQ